MSWFAYFITLSFSISLMKRDFVYLFAAVPQHKKHFPAHDDIQYLLTDYILNFISWIFSTESLCSNILNF